MKVILVNGSPNKNGSTNRALEEVAKSLREEGINTLIYWIGNREINDCIGCGKCKTTGKCIFNDNVNQFIEYAKGADGFIFGSPVYYAHPTARLQAFMDRVFYAGASNLAHKPAAAVFALRRAGSTASEDVINKYFGINQMPIISSTYWNQVFGTNKDEVEQDKEGLNTMYNLGKNMAYILKCIEAGKEKGINHPDNKKVGMNFIR